MPTQSLFSGSSDSAGIIAVYFGARRCAPCRAFLPKLRALHDAHGAGADQVSFDLVYVACDATAADADASIADALGPPADGGTAHGAGVRAAVAPGAGSDELRDALEARFDVRALPTLVFLQRDSGRRLPFTPAAAKAAVEAWASGQAARGAGTAARDAARADWARLVHAQAPDAAE